MAGCNAIKTGHRKNIHRETIVHFEFLTDFTLFIAKCFILTQTLVYPIS